jgi:microcystin-dependent protein
MAEPYLSEIRIVSFSFAPKGWAMCNGQLLPINQNQALFSLLGTTYGGDGRVNFALPNFQGRVPVHVGGTHALGEVGGESVHTLLPSEMPLHQHTAASADPSTTNTPGGNVIGAKAGRFGTNLYATGTAMALDARTVSSVGGNTPHENKQPSLVLNFVIALQGIFPSQN